MATVNDFSMTHKSFKPLVDDDKYGKWDTTVRPVSPKGKQGYLSAIELHMKCQMFLLGPYRPSL